MLRALSALLLVLTLGEVTGILDALVDGCCAHEAIAGNDAGAPATDPGGCLLCPCCHGNTLGSADRVLPLARPNRVGWAAVMVPIVLDIGNSARPFHPPRAC